MTWQKTADNHFSDCEKVSLFALFSRSRGAKVKPAVDSERVKIKGCSKKQKYSPQPPW